MTRALLIFGLFSSLGVALLLYLAGGIEGPTRDRAEPVVSEMEPERAVRTGHPISADGRVIEAVEGLVQTAPPRHATWKDRLSDETIEIPVFFPWRFRADDLEGTQPADADSQGVVCNNVRFRTYRDPVTRAEALAVKTGEKNAYEALVNQTFRADEARVFGRLGEALNRNKTKSGATPLGNTKLILSGNVHVVDKGQGIDIRCAPSTVATVYPEQGRAQVRGPFVMTHEAFTFTGDGLDMEQDKAAGRVRIKILRNPVLRIHSDIHDSNGKPVFNFGGGDFQPTHVMSHGSAILTRETHRRETVITITFTEHVRAEQQGGRSLDAGRVEIVAAQPTVPRAGTDSTGWKLRHFLAEGNVNVDWPGQTSKGEAYLASISADWLMHEIPLEGLAVTELKGDVEINMRGEIALLGPQGRLRASCRDRATIGPHRPGAPTGGHDPDLLQQITLRGDARIERSVHGQTTTEDLLEADAIDLVVLPKESQRDSQRGAQRDSRRGAQQGIRGGGPAGDGARGMVAVHFAALGNVRIGGTRVRGTTHRLIGEALDTERPRVVAEGLGTHISFPDLHSGQRLLGSADDSTTAGAAPGADSPAAGTASTTPEPKWVLQRLLATGKVDIDTSLGGPALGIPAQVSGDELSYSRVSQQAQVLGQGGRLARIAWTAPTGEISSLQTRTLTLDQARGRITAQGGVTSEFYVSRHGLGVSPFQGAGPAADAGETELSVRTDARISVALIRNQVTGQALLGAEQIIRITGPLTAELRSANRTVDRLRAENLELALVYEVEIPGADSPSPMTPTARVAGGRSASAPAAPGRGKTQTLELVELTAGEMHLDLQAGKVRYVEALGLVEMKSKEGRITGNRLTFDGARRQVEVLAHPADWRKRPAVAYLGAGDEHMEIQSKRIALTLDSPKNRPAMLEAESAASAPAVIQLYRRAGSDLLGKRPDARTGAPGRSSPRKGTRDAGLEWFTLTYWGTARMVNDSVTIDGRSGAPRAQAGRGYVDRGNGTVRIVRRLRPAKAKVWDAPSVLWSPSLRVLGSNMLASDGAVREVRNIIAEGKDTTLRSGQGRSLIQVWGYRFDFNVSKQTASLNGLSGRPVRFHGGDPLEVDLDYDELIIDMKAKLPTYWNGPRIVWEPPKTSGK